MREETCLKYSPARGDGGPVMCDHERRIHCRPVVLIAWREGGDRIEWRRYALMRCYACGEKWIEDDRVSAATEG